jgi:pyruvate/2-oxoglutarate dehydrogenase complex dihydrolipoamide dehydrogenase (E3) component
VQQKFGSFLAPINRGIEKDGVFYLFTLRLVPLFPFFLVNLVMGLTPISTAAFYVVSQLGMLFGTALYVNVGAQLGLVDSIPGVLSLGVIRAIVVLALFPWLAKALVRWYRGTRILRQFTKPKRFDTNLVVIGAGSAGLVTSYIAALAQAKVTLVEQHRMGGDCLNTGCVPSKTLLRSAAVTQLVRRSADFGVHTAGPTVDFAAVMQRVAQVIKTIEPHDSVERYSDLGVDCLKGSATIVSPWCVEIDGKPVTTRGIVIATGAKPLVPELAGLNDVAWFTSDTIWQLTELPKRLLVLGAGPIGCELAQAFARLGSGVTLVNRQARVLPREDTDVSTALAASFNKEGITVLHQHKVRAFKTVEGRQFALLDAGDELEFDAVLLALGRKANVEGLGLEALGVGVTPQGTLDVNEKLQTACPTIFACGDVVGPYQFTHMAAFQAWFASINSLFGSFRKFSINYRVVPQAVFVDPEVARVGLNESEARTRGIAYESTHYDLADLDRAIADGNNSGFVKVLTVPGKDRILGVTITGSHAAELLAPFTLAMTHRLGLKKILNTIQVYPTYAESGKFAAGVWRKQHAPRWLYPWLQKLHQMRRGG